MGPGRIDAILGLFRVIFESHHFIDAMLDRSKGIGHRLLRHLLLIASWMLRGPILGLTVSTAAALWVALYVPTNSLQWLPEPLLFGMVFLAVFVVTAWLFVSSWHRRDPTWYDPAFWIASFAAVLAAVGFGAYLLRIPLPCPTAIPAQAADCRQLHVDQVYDYLHFSGARGARSRSSVFCLPSRSVGADGRARTRRLGCSGRSVLSCSSSSCGRRSSERPSCPFFIALRRSRGSTR